VAVALAIDAPAHAPMLESVRCYLCGASNSRFFVSAEDDLTGKPGRFQFVTCNSCGLAYQNPRVTLERIGEFYDEQYIAHRKTRPWGPLAPFFDRAMNKLDDDKDRLVSRYVTLDRSKRVLDVGCATGTFLQRLKTVHGAHVAGVDFKDLSSSPTLESVEFHCGLFYEVPLADRSFDLVTMWHFLEHDYDPLRSLRTAHRVLRPAGSTAGRSAGSAIAGPGCRRRNTRCSSIANICTLSSGRQGSRLSTIYPTARFPPTSTCSRVSRFASSEGEGSICDGPSFLISWGSCSSCRC
jgi:methyltransferase family protein